MVDETKYVPSSFYPKKLRRINLINSEARQNAILALIQGFANPRETMKALFILLILMGLSQPGQTQNLERGKEINATCAGCHGEFGQGGKRGEYPLIAGQREAHIKDQLRSFRARTRLNLPMFPYYAI